MENPCKQCITLPLCKARAKDKSYYFIMWAGFNCELYRKYVMVRRNVVDVDKANELGKLFGYEIDGKVYKEK